MMGTSYFSVGVYIPPFFKRTPELRFPTWKNGFSGLLCLRVTSKKLRISVRTCSAPVRPFGNLVGSVCRVGLTSKKAVPTASACMLTSPWWQGEPYTFLAGMEVKLTQRTLDVKIWTSARSTTQESCILKDKMFIIGGWGEKMKLLFMVKVI